MSIVIHVLPIHLIPRPSNRFFGSGSETSETVMFTFAIAGESSLYVHDTKGLFNTINFWL